MGAAENREGAVVRPSTPPVVRSCPERIPQEVEPFPPNVQKSNKNPPGFCRDPRLMSGRDVFGTDGLPAAYSRSKNAAHDGLTGRRSDVSLKPDAEAGGQASDPRGVLNLGVLREPARDEEETARNQSPARDLPTGRLTVRPRQPSCQADRKRRPSQAGVARRKTGVGVRFLNLPSPYLGENLWQVVQGMPLIWSFLSAWQLWQVFLTAASAGTFQECGWWQT